MEGFARSRTVPGGVQIEVDVDTAREIAALINSESGSVASAASWAKLQAVAKTIANTLEIPR